MDKNQVLENVRWYIEEQGFKEDRLAKRMDMSVEEFQSFLKGESENAIIIAHYLGEMLGSCRNFFIKSHTMFLSYIQDLKVGKVLNHVPLDSVGVPEGNRKEVEMTVEEMENIQKEIQKKEEDIQILKRKFVVCKKKLKKLL